MISEHKFFPPRSDTGQLYPKDLQPIPEKLLRGIQLTSLRICDRQQEPSQRGRLLHRNSSQEENPSCRAEGEHSKIHLTCLNFAMLNSPWRRGLRLLPDMQFSRTLKLSFLQKPGPCPEYWKMYIYYSFVYLRHCNF